MLRGMTGFAQVRGIFKDYEINIEMRSLNHRYFECVVHIPEGFAALEDLIKTQAREQISRARLTAVVSVNNLHPKVVVNYQLAQNYASALQQLNQKLRLENHITPAQIIGMEGVLRLEKIQVNDEMIKFMGGLVNSALRQLICAKDKEGHALSADVLKRIASIRKEIEKINAQTKILNKEKRKRLTDEEYGVFLKNTDIAEELVRISYHVKNFNAILRRRASSGKELDFVSQEIQREANTISAKAQNAKVSSSVIRIKSEIEKIREQLQNAE